MKKYTFLTAAAAAALWVRSEYFHGLEYLYNLSLCRGSKAFFFNCNNITAELDALCGIKAELALTKRWYRSISPERLYITGSTGRALYLRILRQTGSKKWVIAVHGYGCTGRSMMFCAKKFYEHGFNVIIPDLPCHGRSYGRFIGMGQYEYRDILKIADMTAAHNSGARIMLYGVSMGAATVLTATGGDARNISCAVSDCSFSDARSVLDFQIQNIIHMPAFMIIHELDKGYRKKTGYSLKNADIRKFVRRSVTPTLFIHGGADKIVPTAMVYKLYNAAACPKDILIVQNAGHGVSAYADTGVYWKKVFDFADKYTANQGRMPTKI